MSRGIYYSLADLPGPPPPTFMDFLRAHEAQPDECWPWTGTRTRRLWVHGAFVSIRRLSWLVLRSPIPPDRLLLVTCGTESCVNPSHLRQSTSPRGYSRRAVCDFGHPIEENSNRHRQCPTCRRAHGRAAEALIAEACLVMGLTRTEYRAQYRRSLGQAAQLLLDCGVDPLDALHAKGFDVDLVLDGSPALALLHFTGELRTYNLAART